MNFNSASPPVHPMHCCKFALSSRIKWVAARPLLAHGRQFRHCNNFGSYLRVNRPAERVIFTAALDPKPPSPMTARCDAANRCGER
jgi:hypothetical protein